MTDSTTSKKNHEEKALLQPYDYIIELPGKQIRITLSKAFNAWLNIDSGKLQKIVDITQMLHNSSLLIDDIEDNSHLRRGRPVAHKIYGIAQTINTANYVYFLGLEKVLALDHPDATKIFTEQLLELHRGQGKDIIWRDSYQCPTEEEYKEMVTQKTGGLFGLAVRLMQLFSDNKCDLKPLLDNLGLYFQIRDDYANLMSKEYEANKSFAEDLTEGKFSFPIIHGIRTNPDNQVVMNILRNRTTDFEVKKFCVSYLKDLGTFKYTEKVLIELENSLTKQISDLGGNSYLTNLVDELSKIYKNNGGH